MTRSGRPMVAWRSGLAALVLAGLFGGTPSADAQPSPDEAAGTNLDLQLFLPPAGGASTFTIARPEVPRHLTFIVGAAGSWARQPLERQPLDDEGPEEAVVSSLGQAELLLAMGLFEVLEVGVALPVAFAAVADLPGMQGQTEAGLGDVRFELKTPLVRGDFALSARTVFSIPTGREQAMLGVGYWTSTPSAVMAYDLGALRLAAELGYRFRRKTTVQNLEQDDELQLSGGATYAITPQIAAVAELQSRLGVAGDSVAANENPVEADFGLRWTPTEGLALDLGAGMGLNDGYGTATPRVFFVARWATEREPCDAGPEDFDGYMDGDFCADPDNDGDGLEDDLDQCSNDAEDRDGFLDDDGCPDTDNDADGVRDAEDECPLESEDLDGHADSDGCPDQDNDEDGLPDGLDECPMEPEDRDDFQDDDGCPEPGPQQATVTVTDTRILISERIYFDFDTDTIRSVSMPLLNQVADVIKDLPANRGIRVEGYTDDAGDDQYNLDLSYRRARAVVEYLSSRGVPRQRLDYVGYGEVNPVAPNDSIEGRALNRRVEFTIIESGANGTGGEGRIRRRQR